MTQWILTNFNIRNIIKTEPSKEVVLTLLSCILFYSHLHGIEPKITNAIIETESNFNARAIGPFKEVGLMQIRPEYVPETKEQLLDPCTNVKVGTAILKQAKDRCKHTEDYTWILCYNIGITGGNRIKHPKLFPYYVKVVNKLKNNLYVSLNSR